LQTIYDELKATVASQDDRDALLETQAILANRDTMRPLAASRADKRAGRIITIRSGSRPSMRPS